MPALAKSARTVAGNLGVLDAHLAAVAAVDAGGGADEFALALAFDAGKADDLAGMDDEIDLIEAAAAQCLDREQRGADRFRLGGKNLAERPAGDQRHDLGRRNRIRARRLSMISPSRITEMRSASSSTSCSRCET